MLLSLVKSILKELIHDVVYYSDASLLMMSTGIDIAGIASLESTFSSNCVTSDQPRVNTIRQIETSLQLGSHFANYCDSK